MIKIERFSKDAKGSITRNGVSQPLYIGMVVTQQELETLVVKSGTILYTIDEEKIVEVSASTDTDPKSDTPVETTDTETKTEEVAPVTEKAPAKKPAIVKPAPRSKK